MLLCFLLHTRSSFKCIVSRSRSVVVVVEQWKGRTTVGRVYSKGRKTTKENENGSLPLLRLDHVYHRFPHALEANFDYSSSSQRAHSKRPPRPPFFLSSLSLLSVTPLRSNPSFLPFPLHLSLLRRDRELRISERSFHSPSFEQRIFDEAFPSSSTPLNSFLLPAYDSLTPHLRLRQDYTSHDLSSPAPTPSTRDFGSTGSD
jgi:hypothetical protein